MLVKQIYDLENVRGNAWGKLQFLEGVTQRLDWELHEVDNRKMTR